MRSKVTSRALAWLLAVVMVVGLLPMTALAARIDRDDAPTAEVAMGEEAVTAPARAPSKQAEVAAAEAETAAEYEYVLDADGIDDGSVYAIVTSRDSNSLSGNRILYYNGSADRTNQVSPSAMSDDKLSLDTSYPTATQLWEASVVEGGIALRSLAGSGDKYLKLASDSAHTHVDVSTDPQALTITNGVSKSGCTGYSIVQGGYSLNWSSSSIYTHNDPANVLPYRFYKQTSNEPETPETPVEKPRHYFAKAEAGAGPWTIVSDGMGVPNTLSYQTGGSNFSGDLTELGDTEGKLYRIFGAANGTGKGFINTALVDGVRVATSGGGYNASDPNTGTILVTLEAQSNGAYIISFERNGKYYLTADTKTCDGAECAVFSPNKADAVPYFVENDEGFRIYCVGPYTVSFDGGYEGAEDIAPISAMYGTALPTLADREGYTFVGWFDENDTEFVEVTADVTLTAKWEMDPGYTPEEAIADGKTVTYLAFTGGGSQSRWWDTAEEAGDTAKIQLYAASGADSSSTVTLDTDGITAGNYVINFDTGNSSRQAVMHYSDGVSNQCSTVSVVCGNNGPLHLFVFEKAEDSAKTNAFTIKAYNTTKYLSLEASGNNRVFKDDKTTFYVTPVNETNDGSYYLWTATDPDPVPDEPGKEAPPAALETVYEYRLDTDGLEDGVYSINAAGNNRNVGMHDSGNATNQCGASISGNLVTVTEAEHQWTVTKLANGKYTIRGNGGNYLTSTASGAQLALGATAEEFAISHESDGNYTVQNVAGQYLTFADTNAMKWGMSATKATVKFFEKTEVEPDMAQTVFKGTSQNQPLVREDTNSQFRIPALYTLSNGWIVAACDIRWTTTADSPANLDTIVSISKDGGETWDWEVVNYFADFPSTVNSSASASFIDPAIVQTKDGSVWLLVDAQAPHVNGGKIGNGFDDEGRLQISKSPVNGNYSMDNAHDNNLHGYTFDYYVDINNADAGADYTVDGETVKLWPICANADDHQTGYYVDAFFNTYYDYDEGGMQAVLALQRNSTKVIHNNIFYTESEWKVFPTAFIMARKAMVNETNGTLDWGEPRLISDQIKYNTEHFIGVCPGRGFVTEAGENGERIIFPIYDNLTGEKASSVYSDDGGVTWHRGERIPNGQAGKTSESQIVELPDGNDGTFLRIFCRNTNPTISYADSYDGGVTWSAGKLDSALKYGDNTMVSFINLKGYLIGADDTIYTNLILASYPWGTKESGEHRRSNGVVRIGYYDPADGNGPVHWLNENEIRYPGRFNYSCVTQLLDGNNEPTDSFGLLYEKDATGGMEMLYYTLTSEDLLGEGWALVQEVPALPIIESEIVRDTEVVPVIEAAKALDLDMGETGALTAAVTLTGEGTDDGEEAVVTWTSSDSSVATVSTATNPQARLLSDEEVVTAPGEQVVINAVGVGRAYITATTTKNGVTRRAVTEVVVQGEDGIIVPEYYLDEMIAADAAGTTAYTVSADGLEKLIEAGGDAVEEDYTDTLELAATYTDKAKADAAQAQIDEVTKALYAKLTGRDYASELPEPPEVDVYTVGSIADRIYTGEEIEPTVIVRKNGAILTMGYTLEYKNNVNVGEATVNVLVGGKIVATGTFRIVEDTAAGDDTGNTGSSSGGGSGSSYAPPAEEDLDDLDVPLAQLPMTFEDVKADDWFYEAAEFVFAQDMMQGVSATEFRPTMNTTRGMVVTILHRMAKEPEADPAAFADVASTAWYGPAVAWGAQNEVVKGADDGNFHPMDVVTREQLAAFLYRFAEYSGYDVSARGELSGYADNAVVSSWAKDAMSWAVGTGLITGKDGNVLAPLTAANRAELATILTRFCKTVAAEK